VVSGFAKSLSKPTDPALIVVPPEYELDPANTKVPEPFFVIEAVEIETGSTTIMVLAPSNVRG
jgi:hypothetical protein